MDLKRTRSQTAAAKRKADADEKVRIAKRVKQEEDNEQFEVNLEDTRGRIAQESMRMEEYKSYKYGSMLDKLAQRVGWNKNGLIEYSRDVAATVPEIKHKFGICCHTHVAYKIQYYLEQTMPDLKRIVGLSQFLSLKICAGDNDPHSAVYSPGVLIDGSWHRLIAKTKIYDELFSLMSSKHGNGVDKVHHDDATANDQVAVHERYARTRLAAKDVFGDAMDAKAWRVMPLSGWKEIIIAPMGGTEFSVYVPLTCTMEALDYRVRFKYPIDGLRYFFRCPQAGAFDTSAIRQLAPLRTLESYGVTSGSRITFMTRMRGC
jgi:hypothetical protein